MTDITIGIFEDDNAIYLSRKVGPHQTGVQIIVPQDVGTRIRSALDILDKETAALTASLPK